MCVCVSVLDIYACVRGNKKASVGSCGRWGGAQIVIFPGERRHTERRIFELIKEHSEPLESIQQGAHSPRLGCQGTEPCPQALGWGPMLNGARRTHQKELIPFLQWAPVAA